MVTNTVRARVTRGTVEAAAKRIAAVRAELSEAERTGHASVRALRRDLVVLETRLADMIEVVS